MGVEFVPAAQVQALTDRIRAARQQALDCCGTPPPFPDAAYWEALFEANAAAVLAALPSVTLAGGLVVRYRFFGQQGSDLLVRPFVARSTTEVGTIRQLIDWHAPPDSGAPAHAPTRDVELLYRHFSFPHTAAGVFEYWLAMQELWASQRWAHSRLIASAAELQAITSAEGWQVVRPVAACEPAVVLDGGGGARLAVLLQSPLGRFEIVLQQVTIGADQSLCYDGAVLVAAGPRGYVC